MGAAPISDDEKYGLRCHCRQVWTGPKGELASKRGDLHIWTYFSCKNVIEDAFLAKNSTIYR